MKRYLMIVVVFALLSTISCTQSPDSGKSYVINGSIQKGPFVLGSSIIIQPLNYKLNPIGQLYNTFTINNAGHFSIKSEMPTQYAEIIADGYYFDEVVGELSTGTLTLRSITDLGTGSVANVNLLTTLIFQRTRNLVNAIGLSIGDATIQAERELFLTLGISENNIPDVRCGEMDISQDGDHNALLLTISVALQYNRTTGELSELIAKLSTDLADDGVIGEKTIKNLYIKEDISSILDNVYNNLKIRYDQLGVQYTIPEFKQYLSYFIDADGNGVADKLDFIIIERDSVEISPKGSEFMLPIKYIEDINSIDIRIDYKGESEDEWLTITDVTQNIAVAAKPNITKDEKEADIILTEVHSGKSVTIHIRQQAPYLIGFTYNAASTDDISFVGNVENYYIYKDNGDGIFFCIAPPTSITSVTGDITSITIPDTITDIKYNTFSSCANLQTFYGKLASSDNRCVVIRDTLKCFAPVGLIEYTIPNDIASIDNYIFANCGSLTSITVPNSIKEIKEYAFYNYTGGLVLDSETIIDKLDCYSEGYNQKNNDWLEKSKISEIVIGPNIEKIGTCAFRDIDTLLKVIMSDNVTDIGDSAFAQCDNLARVIIGGSVTRIGQCAFSHCGNLTDVTMSNSVTYLAAGAFENCGSLTTITIPEKVSLIDGVVFRNCKNLQNVYCKPITPPTIMGPYIFQYIVDAVNNTHENIGCKIYVPRASLDDYKTAGGWKNYAVDIVPYDF